MTRALRLKFLLAAGALAVSPSIAEGQDPEITAIASATTIVPQVELIILGHLPTPLNLLDLPPLQLTRNGTDVASWYSNPLNSFWSPAEADGTYRAFRGSFTGLVPGSNVFIATICYPESPTYCAADTVTVNYVGIGNPPTQTNPIAELAQSSSSRLIDACAGCASRTVAYSTPAEFIMGGSRSVGLHYSSELARPVGLVEVDAVVRASTVPARLSIRLRRNGSFVTLSNGATEAFLMGDTALVRLAAQFDASSYATGAYDFEVIIGSYWNSGTPYLADTLTARVLIQNESVTPYGSGWTIGGVARIHSQSNGVLLTTGTAAMQFYAVVSCTGSPPNDSCSYTSPTGSFSTLSKTPPTGAYDIVWTLLHRDGSAHKFTKEGLLKLVTDRFGSSSRIDHESASGGPRVWKMIATVRNPGSSTDRTATFAYNGTTGKLTSITLPDGRQSSFTVTAGDLVAITDPDGVTAMTGTYVSNRLVRVSGRNGAPDTVIFDAFGQISEHKSPTVLTETHGSVRISTVISSLRAKLLNGQGTSQGGSAAAAVRRDSAFVRRTEPQGTTVTVWPHRSGSAARAEVRRPDGAKDIWTTSFGPDYQPIAQDSPDAGAILFWTGAELRREISFPALWRAMSTTASYAKFGQVDSVTVLGSVSYRNHFSGDSLLPDSSWHVSSGVAKFKYDSTGRVVSSRSEMVPNVVDSVTYEVTYGNALVRRRVIGAATYSKDSTTYDSSGRPATHRDVMGNSTSFYFDLLNRDTLRIAPLGARTKVRYEDLQGRVTLTDPMNQAYLDSVNALGWVVRQRDPRGNSETFGYDRQGNVVRRTDRNGQVTTVQYDSLNRPTRRIAGTDTTQFGYGPVNTFRAARNANSTDTLWQPSFLGNFRKSFTDRGGNKFTVLSVQSPLNQPTTVEVKYLNSGGWTRTATSSYNTQQHVSAIADFAGKTSTLQYANYVWLATLNNPGHSQLFSRDSVGRLLDISFNYPWTLIAPFGRHLEYDVADRATFERHADFNRVLTYDALGRLATFTDTDTATIRSHTYMYDSVANRRDNGAVLATGNRLTRIEQYNIFYDSAGNVLMKAFRHTDTVRYTWNALGQLTRVIRWTSSAGTDSTSYRYDGWGRRIRKTIDGVVTHYLHSDGQVVMELNSAYSPVTEYTYFPGVDQPHSVRTSGKMYYFARDGLGSVIGLIDTVGMSAKTRYDYTPYGEILVDSGAVVQPFRFKGREWDPEAGLYYMRARYFDPRLGRFISEDPSGLDGGLNPYAFAMGDPINNSDPSGLQGVSCRVSATNPCPIRPLNITPDRRAQPVYCDNWSWDVRCLDEMGWHRRGLLEEQGGDGSAQVPQFPQALSCEQLFAVPGMRAAADRIQERALATNREHGVWQGMILMGGSLVAVSDSRLVRGTAITITPSPQSRPSLAFFMFGHSHLHPKGYSELSPNDSSFATNSGLWIWAASRDSFYVSFGGGPQRRCAR